MNHYTLPYSFLSIKLLPNIMDKLNKSAHFEIILILLSIGKNHSLNAIIALITPNSTSFHLKGKIMS